MQVVEVEFEIAGRMIKAKRWGNGQGLPTIALHGWLDNANSFDWIAPELPELDLIALDFAGHGLSDHRPVGTPYTSLLHVQDVIAVANQLNWDKFNLLGHSMGAEIATHVTQLFADRVLSFIAIDGFAEASSAEEFIEANRRSIEENVNRVSGGLKTFPSQQQMAQRVVANTSHSLETAMVLVARGSHQVDDGYAWRSDPRVRWSNSLRISHEHLDYFFTNYSGQVLVISANEGDKWYRDTIDSREQKYSNLTVARVSGTHHVHLSSNYPSVVAQIRLFHQLDDQLKAIGGAA